MCGSRLAPTRASGLCDRQRPQGHQSWTTPGVVFLALLIRRRTPGTFSNSSGVNGHDGFNNGGRCGVPNLSRARFDWSYLESAFFLTTTITELIE